jgi:hypothetical protein
MKAVVKYGRGKGLVEFRDVPEPKPQDDEVLIEVKAISVCGSDLHIYHDSHPYWPPVVLGHEFSGVIADVGKEVKGWKKGDRIVSETRTGSCGVCYTCQSGFPQVATRKGRRDWDKCARNMVGLRACFTAAGTTSVSRWCGDEPTSASRRSWSDAASGREAVSAGVVDRSVHSLHRGSWSKNGGVTGRSSMKVRFGKARSWERISINGTKSTRKGLEMTARCGYPG